MKTISRMLYFFLFINLLYCCICCKNEKQLPKNENVWNFKFSNVEWGYSYLSNKEKLYIWNNYILFGINTRPVQGSTAKGFFIADKKTGTSVFSYKKDDIRFIFVDDTVYIGEDRLFALDLHTLKEKWEINLKNFVFDPSYYDGIVYFYTWNNDKECVMGFESDTGKNVLSINDYVTRGITVSPVYGLLYYANKSVFKAIDLKTKMIKWKKDNTNNIFWEPFLYKNHIFVFGGKRGGVLSAFDAKTGKLYWEISGVNKALAGPKPIIYEDKIYISGDDVLICINIEKGKKVWEIQHEPTFELPLHIVDHKLYYPVFDKNKIIQYNFDTGKFIKEIYLNHKIHSPFSYEEGTIYYINENTLYAEKVEL